MNRPMKGAYSLGQTKRHDSHVEIAGLVLPSCIGRPRRQHKEMKNGLYELLNPPSRSVGFSLMSRVSEPPSMTTLGPTLSVHEVEANAA